jgi:hypothetical protein
MQLNSHATESANVPFMLCIWEVQVSDFYQETFPHVWTGSILDRKLSSSSPRLVSLW